MKAEKELVIYSHINSIDMPDTEKMNIYYYGPTAIERPLNQSPGLIIRIQKTILCTFLAFALHPFLPPSSNNVKANRGSAEMMDGKNMC